METGMEKSGKKQSLRILGQCLEPKDESLPSLNKINISL